jgi:hypothetical protein
MGLIFETMHLTAEATASRQVAGFPRPPVHDSCPSSALRDSQVGSGQKE